MIETELSEFHKMIVAVMKMHFPKMKPQVVSYQKYKEFHNKTFLDSLKHELRCTRVVSKLKRNRCIFNYLYRNV